MKQKIFYILLVLACFILSVLTFNKINANIGLPSLGHDLVLFLVLFVIYLYIIKRSNRTNSEQQLRSVSIAFLLFSLPSLFFSTGGLEDVYGYLSVLSIPIGIVLGKKLCYFHSKSSSPDLILSIVLAPALISCIWVLTTSNSIALFIENRDYVFTIVVFTPLLYYYRSPILRFSIIFLFLYITIISTKRTALICVMISLVLYVLTNISKIRKINFRTVLLGICLTITISFVAQSLFVSSASDALNITIERMTNLNDKSNEERENIYEIVLARIESSSSVEFLFGHGFNAVSKQIFGHPAHNDYLEVAYNYGFISFVLFTCIFIQMILSFFKDWFKNKLPLSEASFKINTVISILILNMANCFISNSIYTITCMVAIGWALEYTEIKRVLYGK